MIDDDDRIAEQNTGDYFPWWLNDLVTAIRKDPKRYLTIRMKIF